MTSLPNNGSYSLCVSGAVQRALAAGARAYLLEGDLIGDLISAVAAAISVAAAAGSEGL